jgi:NAD(P)-dependent dehydrogenase (short-subunit alcohol dehydrogenase family)
MTSNALPVAIVTGGGTGIGAAITRKFVAAGWRVLIAGRRAAPLEAVAASDPAHISVLSVDLTDAAARDTLVPTALARYGRLDALINNAGYAPMGAFQSSTDEDFEAAYRVNVVAAAALIRTALPHLTASRGAVVNVSTVAARRVLPALSAYLASKAALSHLTRLLAVEFGPLGVRVNAVAPGATRSAMADDILAMHGEDMITAMTPMGRLGEPEDIAATVLFLAGRDAGWVTGQVVEASGGILL